MAAATQSEPSHGICRWVEVPEVRSLCASGVLRINGTDYSVRRYNAQWWRLVDQVSGAIYVVAPAQGWCDHLGGPCPDSHYRNRVCRHAGALRRALEAIGYSLED